MNVNEDVLSHIEKNQSDADVKNQAGIISGIIRTVLSNRHNKMRRS